LRAPSGKAAKGLGIKRLARGERWLRGSSSSAAARLAGSRCRPGARGSHPRLSRRRPAPTAAAADHWAQPPVSRERRRLGGV